MGIEYIYSSAKFVRIITERCSRSALVYIYGLILYSINQANTDIIKDIQTPGMFKNTN